MFSIGDIIGTSSHACAGMCRNDAVRDPAFAESMPPLLETCQAGRAADTCSGVLRSCKYSESGEVADVGVYDIMKC